MLEISLNPKMYSAECLTFSYLLTLHVSLLLFWSYSRLVGPRFKAINKPRGANKLSWAETDLIKIISLNWLGNNKIDKYFTAARREITIDDLGDFIFNIFCPAETSCPFELKTPLCVKWSKGTSFPVKNMLCWKWEPFRSDKGAL